jgi:hypothetical protein
MRVLTEELDILWQMKVIDREVFFYLAQRTDYKTGVIGRRCRVSRGGIALDISERMEPGRRDKVWLVDSDDIKNSIRRLIKVGLYQCLSKAVKGSDLILARVFLVEKLAEHQSAQKQVTQRLPDRLPSINAEIANQNNEIEKESMIGYPGKMPEVTRTNIHQHQQSADKPFAMSLDWKPLENEMHTILIMAGVGHLLNNIDPAWQTEFISHWWGESGRQHTQQQWTKKLAMQIIGYLRNPGLFDQQRGQRVQQEQGKQYFEKNSRALPGWAKPPRDDNALSDWLRANEFGDAPAGYDYQQTRGWLRREIDKRMSAAGMPKLVH